MSTLKFTTSDETRAWARSLVALFTRPCVVLLDGPPGAGKTQVVRWMCEAMGVNGALSPTFAILQRYDSPAGAIDHADLYRLQSGVDLESSGFWDLLLEPQGLLFVEWAGRLPQDTWPRHWKRIFITLHKADGGEEVRHVELSVDAP